MKKNIIFHVIAYNQEAVYVNGDRLLLDEELSAKDLSNLLVEHTPFSFNQENLHEEIESFPSHFSEFEVKFKNPLLIDQWDSVTFTTKEGNHIVYGCGTVLEIKKDENAFNKSYLVRDVKTLKEFEIYPHFKGDEKIVSDTILLSVHDRKSDGVSYTLTEKIWKERKALLSPAVGQKVFYSTDKGQGEGVVEYVYVNQYKENVYRCKIRREDNALVEVYHNNNRYPEDDIKWENCPVLLSSEKDWLSV